MSPPSPPSRPRVHVYSDGFGCQPEFHSPRGEAAASKAAVRGRDYKVKAREESRVRTSRRSRRVSDDAIHRPRVDDDDDNNDDDGETRVLEFVARKRQQVINSHAGERV